MDKIVGSWIGADVSEVVLVWGAPDIIAQVNGAMIYEWEKGHLIPSSDIIAHISAIPAAGENLCLT